ncbi:hypothetical protein RR47_GL001336 [Enterococcus columbae DSM 7374 = ATCC 51263]|nr:hypothetical protein RR47_GL001336 [Enterococcus columbae DSM 7374 = ATCC 51263]
MNFNDGKLEFLVEEDEQNYCFLLKEQHWVKIESTTCLKNFSIIDSNLKLNFEKKLTDNKILTQDNEGYIYIDNIKIPTIINGNEVEKILKKHDLELPNCGKLVKEGMTFNLNDSLALFLNRTDSISKTQTKNGLKIWQSICSQIDENNTISFQIKNKMKHLLQLMTELQKILFHSLENKRFDDAIKAMESNHEGMDDLLKFARKVELPLTSFEESVNEYKQLIYAVYYLIENNKPINLNQIIVSFTDTLSKINSIVNEIDTKISIIFMPYKASMWSALESIWQSAISDKKAKVRVMPVPYFEKNSDGSFDNIVYEGADFPKNVDVFSYENLDWDSELVDVIFIHNPYDENNRITSIHPDFYISNLRKITQKVAYTPYFVHMEPSKNDAAAYENIKHYALTSGVVQADYIYLQSDNIKNYYTTVLTDIYGNETKDYWESKIFAYGSPMIDKILQIKNSKIDLPIEWKEKLYSEKGEKKKVVLYNTSIGAFLEDSENMLYKIKDTIDFFANEDECVLLWRPHPLMKTTIKAMRPELLELYNLIIDKYLEENSGIYDVSADVNRAVAIADLCYGDPGGLIPLSQQINVPVLIQNAKFLNVH